VRIQRIARDLDLCHTSSFRYAEHPMISEMWLEYTSGVSIHMSLSPITISLNACDGEHAHTRRSCDSVVCMLSVPEMRLKTLY